VKLQKLPKSNLVKFRLDYSAGYETILGVPLGLIPSSGEGTAYYHLISRCSNKQFLFRKAASKDRLMDLAKRAAEFSGVKLLALTVMDNHFHILCSVTQSNEPVSQEEIIRRVGVLKFWGEPNIIQVTCYENQETEGRSLMRQKAARQNCA
jgi:REP element-mobilizing transposase RayT